METTHSFGYWVRRRRKALDLTQRELAECAACSVSAVKKIEADMRRPSRQLAQTLADALAIPEEQRALFLRVARGRAPVDELPLAKQPLAPTAGGTETAQSTAGNLPLAVSPLIGREEELDRLATLISTAETRLITVIGPGGVGKSSLALEAARRSQEQFWNGAWFVPLAGVDDPAQLSTAIAVALGLNFAGPLDPGEQLVRQLADRHLLLLLDNFEQLLPIGAELISAMILHVPEITILVTSRERLRLRAEEALSVGGLGPEAARALFLDRAGRARAELAPDQENDANRTIDRICQLVGGLPLALELAATWARLLPPAEILSDLEQNLGLLTGDLRDLPERHRSMQAVFDASWTRLSPTEQKLLAGLSVFAGSFSRDAAESVCGATLPQLVTLHDHSLIQRDGERLRLHELIRQFAANELASMPDGGAPIKEYHAAYYASFLGRLSDLFKSGGSQLAGWQRAIDREMGNIHAAWRWAIMNDQPQRLLPTTIALWRYLDTRGQGKEGLQMFAALGENAAKCRVKGFADDTVLRRTQAMALAIQAELNLRMGQSARHQEQIRQAVSLLDGLDAPDERIIILPYLGLAIMLTRNYADSQRIIEEALALAQSEDHVTGQGLALNLLGTLHILLGKPEEAKDIITKSVALWSDRAGFTYAKAHSLTDLGLAYHALGDYESAQAVQEQALRLTQQVQDNSVIPVARCSLAFHHYAQGKLQLAKSGFKAGLIEAQRFELLSSVGSSVMGLGLVAAAEGLASRAVTLLTYGITQHGEYIAFLLGEPERALAELRAKLPPAEFAAIEARAQEMDLDDLIRLALGRGGNR